MAGDAEKKRVKRNADILLVVRVGTLVAHLLFVALRFFVFSSPSRPATVVYVMLAAFDAFLVYILGSW